MTLKLNLPKLNDSEYYRSEIEEVLLTIKDQIESTYNDKIKVVITVTSIPNDENLTVLSYGIYLSFAGKNDFSYRIMELTCRRPDGGLPVVINAFNGPVEQMGEAINVDQLNNIIELVFSRDRTRTLILTNYKM